MSMKQDYNGWSNRATWAVNLHLSNDQGLYRITRDTVEVAREAWENDTSPWRADTPRIEVADYLREFVETWIDEAFDDAIDSNPRAVALVRDIMALDAVNWLELADHWLED